MDTSAIDVFTVRDLRIRAGDLVRDAEAGRMSVITKRGRPTALTLPFDQRLIELGFAKDLSLFLFERGLITMAKAAKIAGITLDAFMDMLAQTGTVAVDYPPEELDAEMRVAL
jgi:prevent-host-death family protein